MALMLIDTTKRMHLALKASVDVRTIDKALQGLPIKGRAGDRARAVLKAAGLLPEQANPPASAQPPAGGAA